MRQRFVLILMALCVVLFQNCGRLGFHTLRDSASGLGAYGSEVCESLLKQTYSRTYFPLLSNSCDRCHSMGVGSTDLNVSYSAFMAKGVRLVDFQATHPHGGNNVNLTNQISSLKSDWDAGQADYLSCLSNTSSGDEVLGYKLKLESKPIANIETTRTSRDQWMPIEWDLQTETLSGPNVSFAAILKLEARYYIQANDVVGIEFRNPTVRLKASGDKIEVTGLQFYLDQELQSHVTTYSNVSAVFTETTATSLAPGAGNAFAFYPQASASTQVGVEISNIKFVTEVQPPPMTEPVPQPTPTVTFAQLISTDPVLGVFRRNCISCHSGATPAKNLDLSNYAAASGAASLILQRMNSTSMPMPQSGLLPQAERDVVSRWVSSGSPQ